MEPVTQGRSSGSAALPSSALATPAPQLVGDGDHFVGRLQRAGTDQDRDLLAGVQHLGGAAQVGIARARRCGRA